MPWPRVKLRPQHSGTWKLRPQHLGTWKSRPQHPGTWKSRPQHLGTWKSRLLTATWIRSKPTSSLSQVSSVGTRFYLSYRLCVFILAEHTMPMVLPLCIMQFVSHQVLSFLHLVVHAPMLARHLCHCFLLSLRTLDLCLNAHAFALT